MGNLAKGSPLIKKLIFFVSYLTRAEALYSADSDMLKKSFETLLLQSASCFDTVGENFYHGFMLGLCAALESYKSTSNKESRKGRYNIKLRPLVKNLPGIIIKLKSAKNCSEEELKELATTALKQINDKNMIRN